MSETFLRVEEQLLRTIVSLRSKVHAVAHAYARYVVTAGITLVLFTNPVAAQESEDLECNGLPDQLLAIERFLTEVQEAGVALAFMLAAVLLVYVGLLWMSGDPANQERARKTFVNVFIGLLIVVLAAGLVEWVKITICGGS